MRYINPVIKGFYPDPSVCYADGKFYLVTSSFQYFPGVPLFESSNLVNWKQIGHCITRKSQVQLDGARSSGGIFAPTIRYNNGTFYMVTTNTTVNKNFYITTNDIHGQWSEPIFVEQDGIDPSLFFDDDGKVYFISNGSDDFGNNGITQCEIDIKTGKKMSSSRPIWNGSGGRYLESPHMYKINNEYYLMAAEGGTEYGHMITYARSKNVWGDFQGYEHNPVLTNRNLGGYIIQGVGHGDLIQNTDGNWYIVHLGFRQIDQWMPYHNLGRETFLTPVYFDENGWFTAGNNGTVSEEFDINGDFEQEPLPIYTFSNTRVGVDWCFLRHPVLENYHFNSEKFILKGTDKTLDSVDSPTFLALRQKDFSGSVTCNVSIDKGEAGITLYMDEQQHYDLALRKSRDGFEAVLKLNIGDIKHDQKIVPLKNGTATLHIEFENFLYTFDVNDGEDIYPLGTAQTRYLSSEVASGFTGVMIGLYAQHDNTAEFTDFFCEYI